MVKSKEKFMWQPFMLSMFFIVMGSSLYGNGKVGLFGMCVIMFLPSIALAVFRRVRRRAIV